MKLTDEQRAIVEGRSRTTFVAAGAGTGKTSLLVECYVRALLHDGIPMERLPTVTFTRKAAAEMRGRVRLRLMEAGRPDLAARIDHAPIGTIDSYAGALLRRNAVESAVDPRYRVLDGQQAEMLQEEVLAVVWEAWLRDASAGELEHMADFGKDTHGGLLGLYRDLRSAGRTEPDLSLPEPPELTPLRVGVRTAAEDLLGLGLGREKCSKTMRANLDAAEELIKGVGEVPADRGGVAWLRSFSISANCGRSVKPVVYELKDAVDDLAGAIGAHVLAPIGGITGHILREFHRVYSDRKASLGVVDFTDLSLRARDLLQGGTGRLEAPSRLIVDEFQDTNDLQCALFDALGAEAVLTVGDQFQSIYGFRGADVEVFRRRGEALRADGDFDEADAIGAAVASLTRNFRTRPALLEVIDRIFGSEHVFGGEYTGLVAGREGELPRPGRDRPRGALDPAAEFLVLTRPENGDSDDVWQDAESAAVAGRIARLIDREGWARRDIVVLLPTLTRVDRYSGALEARGIDAYIVGGRGYYAREEVTDIVSLLRVVVNPHDDMAMAAVLRSPLGAVTDDALVALRRLSRRVERGSLWDGVQALVSNHSSPPGALQGDDRERLSRFHRHLRSIRGRAGVPGLARLIEQAIEAFDYDLVVLFAPDGRRRFANLRKLMGLADEFESVSGPDLGGFVRFLRHKGDLGEKEGNAATLPEDAEVVRIMTVHQAKGLEFPVVFVAGLGSRGRSSNRSPFLVGSDGSVALDFALATGGGQSAALGPVERLKKERREREEAEQLRLAYVAATRAEERLFLVGTSGLGKRTILQKVVDALDLPEDIESSMRPHVDLDLVVTPVGESTGDENPADDEDPAGEGGRGHTESLTGPDQSACVTPSAPRDGGSSGKPSLGEDGQTAPPPPDFPTDHRVGLPLTRLSFSALSLYGTCPRRFYVERVLGMGPEEADPRRERYDEFDGDAVTARDIGIAVHRILELAPLHEFPRGLELEALVGRVLEEQGIDSEDVRDRCTVLAEAFERSPIARLPGLRAAQAEVPFLARFEDVTLTGVYDLLLRDESLCGANDAAHWRIVDYKTNRLDGRNASELMEPYSLQAELYAWTALVSGAASVTASFLFLERPEEPVDLGFTQCERPSLEERLRQELAALERGEYPPDRRGCAHCGNRTLCEALG